MCRHSIIDTSGKLFLFFFSKKVLKILTFKHIRPKKTPLWTPHNMCYNIINHRLRVLALSLSVISAFPCLGNGPSMGSLFWWQTKGQVKSPTAPEGQKPVIISQGWSLDPGPHQQGRQSVEFSSQRQVITAENLTLLHCQSNSGLIEEWDWAVLIHLIWGNQRYFLFHSFLPTAQALSIPFAFLLSHYFHLLPPLQLQTSLSSPRPRNGVIGSGGRVKKEALLPFTSPLWYPTLAFL